MNVSVTPIGDTPRAIKATMSTLAQLGVKNMEERDGKIVGVARDPNYVKFACDRQGYARHVEVLS